MIHLILFCIIDIDNHVFSFAVFMSRLKQAQVALKQIMSVGDFFVFLLFLFGIFTEQTLGVSNFLLNISATFGISMFI